MRLKKFTREDLIFICRKELYKKDEEPFVLSYNFDPIRVLITKKENLLWLKNSTNISIDATYKVNIYGFPVIVVGFFDLNNKFFCSAICFCQNEETDTLVWILREIKEYLKKENNTLGCKNVIGDNAPAISAAVKEFDPSLLRTNCWAHISRLISAKTKSLKDLEKEFKKDVWFIQCQTDERVYYMLRRLLKEKYAAFECTKEFIETFSSLYLENNKNWYEAYDVFSPSTNNGIERLNLLIKQKYIMWTRVEFNDFIRISKSILDHFYTLVPSLGKIVYNKSEQGEDKSFLFIMIKNQDNLQRYLVTSENEHSINVIRQIKQKFHSSFANFNDCSTFYNLKSILQES